MPEGKSNQVSDYATVASSGGLLYATGSVLMDGKYPVIPDYRTTNTSLLEIQDLVSGAAKAIKNEQAGYLYANSILKPGDYYVDYIAPEVSEANIGNGQGQFYTEAESNQPVFILVPSSIYVPNNYPYTRTLGYAAGGGSPFGPPPVEPAVASYPTSNDSADSRITLYQFIYKIKNNDDWLTTLNAIGELIGVPQILPFSTYEGGKWQSFYSGPAPAANQISSPDEYLYHYRKK